MRGLGDRLAMGQAMLVAINTSNAVLFEALREAGLLDYEGIQRAIETVRHAVPKEQDNPMRIMMLNEMERNLQPGRPTDPLA